MARQNYLFTSESVSEGHPDKVCDRISDEIVDLVYREAKKTGVDPWQVRVACETLATTNRLVIAGEVRVPETLMKTDKNGNKVINPSRFRSAARRAVRDIGYEQDGFHWKNCKIDVLLHSQSADIAQGVDNAADRQGEEGAGDQGIMFGYACNETPDLMPATLDYSHKILERLAADRKSGAAPFLEPDAKSQVTLRYENGKPTKAVAIVVSTQHAPGYHEGDREAELKAYVRKAVGEILPDGFIDDETVWHINPTGAFEIGGPDGDAGLTGRKIIVDTYGGAAPHGGGAFSGKDPTKVDRSAAYITRYLAKNVVAAGLATHCTIQLSYAIGVSEPLSVYVDLHGTGTVSEEALEKAIRGMAKLGGLTPRGIRTHLGLNKPIYRKSAAYGHFGRTAEGDLFPWERTDLVDDLKAALA